MRRMILPLMLFVAAACKPAAAPLSDEDVAAIRSLDARYTQAILARDTDAGVALYTDDAVVMSPNAPVVVGKDAIRDWMASWFALEDETTEYVSTSIKVDGVGDLAFDCGTWSWTGVPPGMTEPITDGGKYMYILRRQPDGSWLYVADIWNSDTPSPGPE